MAPYDSDSSEGEGEDFTETDVLLGYASKDPGDDSISRLGGRPDWLDPETPPSATLARCAVCKAIMVLLLQLDAELPECFPGHERRLYVFACQKKSCRRRDGSIRALRSLRVAPGSSVVAAAASVNGGNNNRKKNNKDDRPTPKEEPRVPSNLGETLFGAKAIGSASGANPFATSSSATAAPSSNPFASASNPFSAPAPAVEPATHDTQQEAKTKTNEAARNLPKTFAETLSLNNDPQATSAATTSNTPTPPEPWPPEASQPKPYPIAFLSEAEYETLDPTPLPVPQATAKVDLDSDAGGGGGGGKEDKEVFESTMDAAFQRFADRLAQNPEQCIRYEFAGTPLLYSKTDAVGRALAPALSHDSGVAKGNGMGKSTGMPRCANCGAPRVFEVQLCPHAITELEADDLSLEGMDWGTILVGVCERDCQARAVDEGRVGYLEEWAGVQWEEMGSAAPGGGGRR